MTFYSKNVTVTIPLKSHEDRPSSWKYKCMHGWRVRDGRLNSQSSRENNAMEPLFHPSYI